MKKNLYLFIILALGVTACYKSDTISSKATDRVLVGADTLHNPDSIKTLGGGSALIYHADFKNLEYDLSLTFIDSLTIDYSFTISKNGEVLKEIANKATFAPKAIYTVEGKYGFRFSGIKFETSENQGINIFIQQSDSSYASFSYTPIFRGNSSLTNLKDTPVMFRCGAGEPYDEYLKRTFRNILEYHRKIYDESESPNVRTHHINTYNKHLARLRALLEEIERNGIDYNLSSHTKMLDQIVFYEMDSVKTIFKEYGLLAEPLQRHQSISYNTGKYILVTAKVDKTGKIVEDRFVNIEITDKLERPKNLRIGELPFFGESRDFKKYGDKTIAVFRGFGFESVDHLISIWDENHDNYVLSTILDQRISVGIGTVRLDTLLDLSSDKCLIIGEKSGGDAGEIWGSLWIGIWIKPRALEIVYEKEWGGSDWLEYTEVIDYTISDDLIMTIETSKRYASNMSKKDSLISFEAIDLKTFR